MRESMRAVLAGWLCAVMMVATFPAHAGMIGTERMLAGGDRAEHAATVEAFMAQDVVRDHLLAWGVDESVAQKRVARLSDEELQELATRIDNAPAGAGALAVVGVVFIVLLILELVGVTNIFTRI